MILRADFDVSLQGGRILDDFRIRASLPTIRYLLRRGARLRIISHLDRPKGRVVRSLSLRPVERRLQHLLARRVRFLPNPLQRRALARWNDSREILFFENVRFFPGEEKNNRVFARRLARWGSCYVNDAFGNIHRNHASMAALATLLPAYAGLRLEREVRALGKIFTGAKPRVLLLGGAKLETKLPLIQRFLSAGDTVLVGGALANTIFLAKGFRVGKSLRDPEIVKKLRRRHSMQRKLYLPIDVRVAKGRGASPRAVAIGGVGAREIIFDIGPKTVSYFGDVLRRAKIIIWNGPLGLVEAPRFSQGTAGMARLLRRVRGFKVVGGGDLVAFLGKKRLLAGFDHVSTGGGAMLEFLSGKSLPGLKALQR